MTWSEFTHTHTTPQGDHDQFTEKVEAFKEHETVSEMSGDEGKLRERFKSGKSVDSVKVSLLTVVMGISATWSVNYNRLLIENVLMLNLFDSTSVLNKLLENVAVVMHCNLRLPDAAPVPIHFNFITYAKFEVAQPICYCLIAFFTADTLYIL